MLHKLEKLVYTDKVPLKEEVACNNTMCLGYKRKKAELEKKGIKKEFNFYLSEASISVVQIREYYCEVSLRCPYCNNLLASFGLRGLDLEKNHQDLKKVNWAKIISEVRNEWWHLRFSKLVYDFGSLKKVED